MKNQTLTTAIATLLTLTVPETLVAGSYSIDFVITPYQPSVVDSWFFDINNQGQSAGYIVNRSGNTFQTDAVLYRSGSSQVLASSNTFGFTPPVSAYALNNLGEALGTIDDLPYFFGTSGPAIPIEVPGSTAFLFIFQLTGGLNDSGNALISFYPNDPMDVPPGGFAGLALWNQQGSTALTALDPIYPYLNPPDPEDFLSGPSTYSLTQKITRINNANQFAADVYTSDFDPGDPANPDDDVDIERPPSAYVYDGNGAYSILENPVPGELLRPIAIDEAGTVFGWAGERLALWGLDGVLQSFLPDPTEPLDVSGTSSYPRAQRNELGQVVAVTLDRGLLFYDPITNAWTDITPSIDGLEAGTLFGTIQGFNDQGQFIGLARPPQGGGSFGYVVSPIPEPGSVALLLAAGCLASGMKAGRRRRAVLPS